MLKQRIAKVMIGLALVTAVAGVSGIMGDSMGLSVTAEVHACQNGGSQGGGC